MPIFEYRCRACGRRFETLHARADEAAPACPGCGAPEPEKMLSAFAVTHESRPAPAGGCCAGCACRRD